MPGMRRPRTAESSGRLRPETKSAAGLSQSPMRKFLGNRPASVLARRMRRADSGSRLQGENEEDRTNADVIENSFAGNGADQLREHTLISGLAWNGGGDVISLAEKCNSDQQKNEHRYDGSQRDFRVPCRWIAEGGNAVTHGLYAGHCDTATGKGPQ